MKYDIEVNRILEQLVPGLAPVGPVTPAPEGALDALWTLVQLADPTIITSIPDFINATIKYNNEPTEENLVTLLVCMLFIVPVFETIKLVKFFKKEDGIKVLTDQIIKNKNIIINEIKKKAPQLENLVSIVISKLNK